MPTPMVVVVWCCRKACSQTAKSCKKVEEKERKGIGPAKQLLSQQTNAGATNNRDDGIATQSAVNSGTSNHPTNYQTTTTTTQVAGDGRSIRLVGWLVVDERWQGAFIVHCVSSQHDVIIAIMMS